MEINFQKTGMPIFNFTVQQNYNALILLNRLICSNPDVKTIIEIGTARGGLSIFFSLCLFKRKGTVYTIDILPKEKILYYPYFKQFNTLYLNIDSIRTDAFELIKETIKDTRTLIFCDGGNKPAEFKLYSRSLKQNDIIMAHDWGTEIKQEHLERETLEMLTPFHQEEFNEHKTMILSMIKK